MSRVAVAMSGGVDSSVAAALAVEKYGQDNVFGVTMRLFCYAAGPERQSRENLSEKSCCSLDAVNDAKSVCQELGIAHYALNMEREFEDTVIENFISEYKLGHTPIPCVLCNSVIKFDYLLKKVRELGADYLATGHYARVVTSNQGLVTSHRLLRGVDKTKDQSYFLYGLNQEQLAHTLFPLGGMKKTEVRRLAAKLKLKTAAKRESQGICFVTEGRVTDWLEGKIKSKPGDIVTTCGAKAGEHEGIVFYTVGQRKRIGGGYSEPMYVLKIDTKLNRVIIGTEKELYRTSLVFKNPHWIGPISFPKKCTAKIRYNMDDAECIVQTQNTKHKTPKYKVTFSEPQRAITPGQSIVFYDGEIVLGGGIIDASLNF